MSGSLVRGQALLPAAAPAGALDAAGVPASQDDQVRAPSLHGTVAAGLTIVALFFGGFLGWSMFADIDSAVVAQGTVVVDSHRKTVQHLEGGILRQLLVKEGDHVRAGQPLAYLDSTQADSALGQLVNQSWSVKAQIARLRAEQAGSRDIVFPEDLKAAMTDPAVAALVATQRQLFAARWRAVDSQIAVLQRKIDQFREAIASDNAQLGAIRRQQTLTQTELDNVQKLYSRGYEKLPRLLALQRSVADLQGKQSELRGDIGKARQSIAGAEMEISAARDNRLADIGKEMQDALAQAADIADKLRAARDVRRRRTIVSPQDGIVMDIKVFTDGGVVQPGQPIMDVVPTDDSLLVEARLRPQDMESIHVGIKAQVVLTAYKRTEVPPIDGHVVAVSADKLTDQRTGEPYFTCRVAVNSGELSAYKQVKLQPGMPAQVMLVTGERRAISYFIDPLTERMRGAFRER
jgi:HlyD family secretion protein